MNIQRRIVSVRPLTDGAALLVFDCGHSALCFSVCGHYPEVGDTVPCRVCLTQKAEAN